MTSRPRNPGVVSAPTPPRPIQVAFIADANRKKQTGSTPHTWEDLAALLSSIQPGPKPGKAWIPADIDPGPRQGALVRSVSVCVLDIEAKTVDEKDDAGKPTGRKTVIGPEPPDFAAMMEIIDGYGWRCIGHTSHSHCSPDILPSETEHQRYRLVFDIDRDLAPTEINPLVHHMARVLGVSDCFDTKCTDPARLFFLPRCPPERLPLFQFRNLEGDPLPVDRMLSDAAALETKAQPSLLVQDQGGPPAAAATVQIRKAAASEQASSGPTGKEVIEAFKSRYTKIEMLERNGYTAQGEGEKKRWIRPNSGSGKAAVWIQSESGRIWSEGGDDLNDGKGKDSFDIFRILEHGDKQNKAIAAAAILLGMNRKSPAARDSDLPPPAPPQEDGQAWCGGAESASVNVGECPSPFLHSKKNKEIEEKANISSPEKIPSDHVHDVNHVHPDDPGTIDQAVKLVDDAIRRCPDDPAALAGELFNDAVRLIRENDQGEWFRVRTLLKKARPNGVLMSDIDRATRPATEAVDDRSVADDLVALVQDQGELFHAEDGSCFVVLADPPRRCFNLENQTFSEWLSYAYYRATETPRGPGRVAGKTAIENARSVLSGIAKNDGPERKVFFRVARHEGAYYLDLGNDQWNAAEIDAHGWRIVDRPPVHFWRTTTSRALLTPVSGGDLELLWNYANIPEPERPLILAWMLEAMRPETPFPVAELIGPQGAAKSSTEGKVRRCIDPNAVDLRAAPKSVEDMYVSAGCNWVVALNNLSALTGKMQDALCSLATGGGFAGRTLFTNSDETLIEAKRPVILNGIIPLVTAQDLTDRVLHIELPEIDTYRSETEIDADFERDAPLIVGGLLDLFVKTLAKLPAVVIPRPPRMADFARLGEAMMQAQGRPHGDFLALYERNRNSSIARSLEASPVAVAIRAMVGDHMDLSEPVFEDTMGKLHAALDKHRESNADKSWPQFARGLGDILRRQRPALAKIGIVIDISKPGKKGVIVKITAASGKQGERGERRERDLKGFFPNEQYTHREVTV